MISPNQARFGVPPSVVQVFELGVAPLENVAGDGQAGDVDARRIGHRRPTVRTQAFQDQRGAVRAGALETIQEAAEALLSETGVSPRQVVRSGVVGNPVMIHILHDLNPLQLTQAPYIPLLSSTARRPPGDFGWSFQGRGTVETLPMISAWVGSDTTAREVEHQAT